MTSRDYSPPSADHIGAAITALLAGDPPPVYPFDAAPLGQITTTRQCSIPAWGGGAPSGGLAATGYAVPGDASWRDIAIALREDMDGRVRGHHSTTRAVILDCAARWLRCCRAASDWTGAPSECRTDDEHDAWWYARAIEDAGLLLTDYAAWCESLVGSREQVPVIETGVGTYVAPDTNGQDGVRFVWGWRLEFNGRMNGGKREMTYIREDG